MRNILIKSFAASLIVVAFAIAVSAQSNSKIVPLVSGKAVVEKFTLAAEDGIAYMLKVKNGNIVKYTVTGSYTNGGDAQGLSVALTKLGSDKVLEEAQPGEEKMYQFQSSGDFEITVMNPGNRKANIKLNVELNPATTGEEENCAGCENSPNYVKPERIKLAKGESDVDLDINLDARETKTYVAYVGKGKMTCILPNTNLGTKVTIKINGKVLNPNVSTCSAHSAKAEDQVIEFINNGNKEIPFMATVGFHEH
ncbi:MAG: hypothetical protein QM785_10205 [Pyrinomonadaceae bacterium]